MDKIKTTLKNNRHVYGINAYIKARQVKKRYKKLVSHYSKLSIQELNRVKKNKLEKVFYFGGDEHQDKSGFLQGLAEHFELRYFTQENGKYGAYTREQDDCAIRNGERLVHLFEVNKNDGFIPDILLMQTWAWRVDTAYLKEIKSLYGCLIINIGMDDRHSFIDKNDWSMGTRGLVPVLDLALTCAPECVDWYKKEGVDSVFFPEASHSDFFYPQSAIEKKYQVGFIGAKYGVREEIVEALKSNGISVMCYGNGWATGRLALSKTNSFFNECKIVLGVGTIGHTRDFFALKLRDFDALMSGAVYVTHHNPDLEVLFENGKEIFLAKGTQDYVNIITRLLSNEGKLENYRNMAYKKALNEHTYSLRFQNLKEYLMGERDEIV